MSFNIFRESVQIVFWFIRIAVTSCVFCQFIFFLRNNHRVSTVCTCLLNIRKHISISKQTLFSIFRRLLFNLGNKLSRIHTVSHTNKLLHRFFAHTTLFALKLCKDLIYLSLNNIFFFYFF